MALCIPDLPVSGFNRQSVLYPEEVTSTRCIPVTFGFGNRWNKGNFKNQVGDFFTETRVLPHTTLYTVHTTYCLSYPPLYFCVWLS